MKDIIIAGVVWVLATIAAIYLMAGENYFSGSIMLGVACFWLTHMLLRIRARSNV